MVYNRGFLLFSRLFPAIRPSVMGSSMRSLSSGASPDDFGLSSAEYDKYSQETLESLCEYFEHLASDSHDLPAGFDCEYSNGVLTLKLGNKGTYVINRQPPNKQIWLSSPLSGPKRYDFDKIHGSWIYRRETDKPLDRLLDEELSELLKISVKVPTKSRR